MHVHSCCFAYIKPIAFSLFWLPSPSSSLKLPIIMVKLSCVTAANSSSMIVYVQMDKWIKNGLDHKLNFLIHFSLNFPLPDRTKKQHMDFWYDRSKYDLMCFSFTWSHSLKVFYVTHLRRVFLELWLSILWVISDSLQIYRPKRWSFIINCTIAPYRLYSSTWYGK